MFNELSHQGNPFGYLRREPWKKLEGTRDEIDEFERIPVYEDGSSYFVLHVGKLQGVWVAGYDYNLGRSGGYARPGLSWGWFDTKVGALVYTLSALIVNLGLYGKIKKALVERLNEFRQMDLFGGDSINSNSKQ